MVSAKFLLPALLLPLLPLAPSLCNKNCKVDLAGYVLTKNFEGYSTFVYKDAAGYDTIGFGHLMRAGEKIKQPLMGDAAQELLEKDMLVKETAINRLVKVQLRQEQFDSLADFTFNLGERSLARSTLLKRVNAERHADAPGEFMKWTKAGGTVLRGLELRRQAEAALYSRE